MVRLIDQAAPHWRFDPVLVDGKPVRARTRMSVRVILNRKDEGTYQLRIGGATFGDETGVEGEAVTVAGRLTPPKYPANAYMSGIQGTVYLVLKIDRDGRVAEAVEEQVNLTVLGSDRQMEQGRALLARAARTAAKKWRYDVPVRGPLAGRDHWSVRVPVSFALCDGSSECRRRTEPAYGSWETYIPGPKHRVPWITDEESRAGSDAMVAGRVYPVDGGPRLLTPLGQG